MLYNIRALLASTLIAGCGAAVPAEEPEPCTVTQEEDGSATIACPDGTTANITSGADGADGEKGDAGINGDDGGSCTVTDNGDGTKTIACDDGTETVVNDYTCTVTDNGDGTKTIACDDGTSVTMVDGATTVIVGDVIVTNSLDISFLANVTEITGDLIDDTHGVADLEFPALETIGGNLEVNSYHVTSLRLPALTTIGGQLNVDNTSISILDLSSLESTGALLGPASLLRVAYNPFLVDLEMPLLTTMGPDGAVSVMNNSQLPSCEVDALVAQLTAAGFTGSVTESGNDDTAVCD